MKCRHNRRRFHGSTNLPAKPQETMPGKPYNLAYKLPMTLLPSTSWNGMLTIWVNRLSANSLPTCWLNSLNLKVSRIQAHQPVPTVKKQKLWLGETDLES